MCTHTCIWIPTIVSVGLAIGRVCLITGVCSLPNITFLQYAWIRPLRYSVWVISGYKGIVILSGIPEGLKAQTWISPKSAQWEKTYFACHCPAKGRDSLSFTGLHGGQAASSFPGNAAPHWGSQDRELGRLPVVKNYSPIRFFLRE